MYFPDELWSIVKEYAGIYSVGTKYKISKEKLLEFYETEFNVSIKNKAKCKADVIKKYIMNQIRFKMTRDKWVALIKSVIQLYIPLLLLNWKEKLDRKFTGGLLEVCVAVSLSVITSIPIRLNDITHL